MNDLAVAPPMPTLSNIEAEAAVLGALLCQNDLFDRVADILSPDDFSEPLHRRIYHAALTLTLCGQPANPITLKGRFENDEALQQLGGIKYLAQLTGDMIGLLDPFGNARLIRDLARRRAARDALIAAAEACADEDTPLSAVADMAFGAVGEETENDTVEASGGALIHEHMKLLEKGDHGVTCGSIPALDTLWGSLRPSQFIVLAARPAMGKTATALSYALGAARRGHGVLFVSLEMSGPELGARLAANRIFGEGRREYAPFSCINDGRLNQGQRQAVAQAAADIDRVPLTIIDTGGLTVGRLSRMVRRQKRRFEARGSKLELVIIDYLQLLRTDQRMRSNYEAVSEISTSLKELAKTQGIALMALAQLSREVEKRPDKRPQLADLRDSGQIEQDADKVLFLLRQEYYLGKAEPDPNSPKFYDWQEEMDRERGGIEFILAKTRQGVEGVARGEFFGAYQAVLG